jgi:DNA-binding transcriptional ArsR family regulator
MTDSDAACALAALGHEARLAIFRLLVRTGPEGLSTGTIASRVALPPSTLAHHLASLVDAGLVNQFRVGRSVLNRVDFSRMREVLAHVARDCCAGLLDEPCPTAPFAPHPAKARP